MHDTLEYFKQDPIGRRYHHHKLTFRSMYFWSENFVLPFSHDEVVHGKRSMIEKMPGDLWQRFANLRTMYGMMWAQPGKKLLFQGGEFGQYKEWAFDASLDWNLLGETPFHTQLMAYVTELNRLYRELAPLHVYDVGLEGFEWIDANDAENSVYSFIRKGRNEREVLLAVFNCTPVPRYDYRVGVPVPGRWREVLNSDAETFGGSGMGNMGGVDSESVQAHGRGQSVRLTLPPLAALYFVPEK
jgi:1,4-alpha-glucan branching enzyme